ncbi:MAG: hypothetical protein AAF558_14240 [Verrucomicrobiota bacterium]
MLPAPKIDKVDFAKLKSSGGREWDYYSSYRFDGAVRVQGIYPRGRYSKWEYDLVYSFKHASNYEPKYFSKNQYGIRFSDTFLRSLVQHVARRNNANFYDSRTNTIDEKLFNKLLKAGFKRLAMGNMHVAGWDDVLAERIADIKPSDVVEIGGFLVDVHHPARDKWIAKSSLALGLPDDYNQKKDSREFFGCEIIWIDYLEIYRAKEGERIMNFGGTPVVSKGMLDPIQVYWSEHQERRDASSQPNSEPKQENPEVVTSEAESHSEVVQSD